MTDRKRALLAGLLAAGLVVTVPLAADAHPNRHGDWDHHEWDDDDHGEHHWDDDDDDHDDDDDGLLDLIVEILDELL